jgi:cobalt-precorrin 5A hydrolase/precorrin-3B C17-methyltransferase
MTTVAVVVLNCSGVVTAEQIRGGISANAVIFGLAGRVPDNRCDEVFSSTAELIQQLYADGSAVIGICAAGILIRSLAPVLATGHSGPPVIAVSADGKAVVPLLGGLSGTDELAGEIAAILHTEAAVTGAGARKFGITLGRPPEGYQLSNPHDAKRITSDLLAGEKARLTGDVRSAWLERSDLPFSPDGSIEICINSDNTRPVPANGLLYVADLPANGSLTILGLGPGASDWLSPQARDILDNTDDLVGYATYLKMLENIKPWQRLHPSGNRVEIHRAMEALDLAQNGRNVALVCSGDPGIFAMAGAVMQALDENPNRWPDIDPHIIPGISAMQAASARTGAILGHDFCVISLSDIRKPWKVIENRIIYAAKADMALAIYNPASKKRRQQLAVAIEVLIKQKGEDTPAVIAKNIGREGEFYDITTLGDLDQDMVDMRTILLVGSSKSRIINRPSGKKFVYTPRSYD